MQSVKISPKFQVVIPRRVRESMHLTPGQEVQIVEYGTRIELVPMKSINSIRGFAKGINTRFTRDGDRV